VISGHTRYSGFFIHFDKRENMDSYYLLIRQQYKNSRGNSTALFQTILAIAGETGMDTALSYLEQCVMEKRLAWIDHEIGSLERSCCLLQDAYNAFFEHYLGLSIPRDGELVEATSTRLVVRWWNECPTLNACRKLGLDTRTVCRKAYQRPVDALLQRIDPRLHFERNYEAIRPYAPYCEEIIRLDKE
jgi:hypothetical protein